MSGCVLVHMHCRKKKHSCLICQAFFHHHRAESASTSGEWPTNQRPHSLRFWRLHSLHSSFFTRLRPSLGKLKTEAGGCIKVRSGKLPKKNEYSLWLHQSRSSAQQFIRPFLANFYPFSTMGYLRSVFRDEAGTQWSNMMVSLVCDLLLITSSLPLKASRSP